MRTMCGSAAHWILLRKTRRTNPLLAVRGSDFASQNKEDYMANVIDDATIDYVGILAKLELSDEEK